jgi:hypothetical protein
MLDITIMMEIDERGMNLYKNDGNKNVEKLA